MVNALLCRVGADQSVGGGSWNGLVDTQSGNFAYVAIPEPRPILAGLEKPYSMLAPVLSTFGMSLPPHLHAQHMHLDPDFDYLTYGDQGERAGDQDGGNQRAGDQGPEGGRSRVQQVHVDGHRMVRDCGHGRHP